MHLFWYSGTEDGRGAERGGRPRPPIPKGPARHAHPPIDGIGSESVVKLAAGKFLVWFQIPTSHF